jgi:hypothetical protein
MIFPYCSERAKLLHRRSDNAISGDRTGYKRVVTMRQLHEWQKEDAPEALHWILTESSTQGGSSRSTVRPRGRFIWSYASCVNVLAIDSFVALVLCLVPIIRTHLPSPSSDR